MLIALAVKRGEAFGAVTSRFFQHGFGQRGVHIEAQLYHSLVEAENLIQQEAVVFDGGLIGCMVVPPVSDGMAIPNTCYNQWPDTPSANRAGLISCAEDPSDLAPDIRGRRPGRYQVEAELSCDNKALR
jgi:hypothetical protein